MSEVAALLERLNALEQAEKARAAKHDSLVRPVAGPKPSALSAELERRQIERARLLQEYAARVAEVRRDVLEAAAGEIEKAETAMREAREAVAAEERRHARAMQAVSARLVASTVARGELTRRLEERVAKKAGPPPDLPDYGPLPWRDSLLAGDMVEAAKQRQRRVWGRQS